MHGFIILVVLFQGVYSQVVDTSSSFHQRFFLQRSPITNASFIQSVPFATVVNTTPSRAGPLARGNNAQYAPTLPCCRDRFGEQACQSLSRSQPEIFERRCLSDHDFNTLDCCAECRNYITQRLKIISEQKMIYRQYQLREYSNSLESAAVLQRQTFLDLLSAIQNVGHGCSNAEFAVRVCRHTCGYCNDNLYASAGQVPLCSKGTGVRKLRYAP